MAPRWIKCMGIEPTHVLVKRWGWRGYGWWLDLIFRAAWREENSVARGTLKVTVRQLAERWGTSRGTVRRYLHFLEGEGMIAWAKGTVEGHGSPSRIAIANYDHHQGANSGPWSCAMETPHRERSEPDVVGHAPGTNSGPLPQKEDRNTKRGETPLKVLYKVIRKIIDDGNRFGFGAYRTEDGFLAERAQRYGLPIDDLEAVYRDVEAHKHERPQVCVETCVTRWRGRQDGAGALTGR